ncbi:MAG: hypothetical protein KatS3mg060_2735 [Dehalococcoidia bacterium]|nr:MAG: hypothetical protein KatS3mg060_2735 [Dehalococcoidia bacterium]
MTRNRIDPVNRVDLPVERVRPELSYVRLTDDPATGGWTRLLIRPAGHVNSRDQPHRLEYHTAQEEIVVLEGSVTFGDYYRATALAYLNHPPFWLHPAEQRFDPLVDTVMLIRLSKPIDTTYLPIPDGWDGREFFAKESDEPRGVAISALQLDEVRFGPLLRDGEASGDEAGVLWHNPADGVVTWLWRIPRGWRGAGDPWQAAGASDELYVLAGDLTTVYDGRTVRLTAGSYYCAPDEFSDGGREAHSEGGLLAVRWSSPVSRLTLPEVGHRRQAYPPVP